MKIVRKEQVHILLSKAEKAALERYAQENDRSVTATIRRLLAENVDGFEPKKKP